jgi:DNA gyrase subunit B
MNFSEGKNKLDMVLTYAGNYSSTIVPYVNTGLTEAGPHITQIKTVITREFNKFFKEKKWLKEKDTNLTGDDIQEGMYVVFNITAPNVGYDAQVKSRITKIDMSPFTSALSTNLDIWLNNNEKEVKNIFEKAAAARKARDAAKKARDAARKVGKNKKQKLLNLPTKLVDCWGKNRLDCELMIAEGDSAASGLIECRNSEINAIFPIRGKIIAAYKNSSEKIFANQEVINLIKAIGLDLDTKTNKLIYDVKKLRYGKILLCADADPDGASIRNLLIEMFWWLCPELILNGHIYTTMPPLFRITTKKNEYIYLKDENELNEYKNKHKNEKFLINRNKGLGEQDSEELADALVNPDTRNIAKIIVNNESEAKQMIEMLLGTSVPPRRRFLLQHEGEANESD